MKICYYFRHLNDPLGRGIHARSLVEAWGTNGNKVTCIPYPPLPRPLGRRRGIREVVSSWLPRPVKHRLMQTFDNVRSYYAAPDLLREVEASDADVLIARWSQFDHTLDRLVAAVRCPVVAEVNGVIHSEMLRFRGVALPASQVRRELAYLRAVDFVICISEEVQEELVSLGVEAERSAIVPNGADCELFHPFVKGDEALRDWTSGEGVQLVAFCGTASLVHDTSTLLLATEHLADSVPRSLFLFVGPLEHEVKRLMSRRPDLVDRIRVTGAVPHDAVPSLLAPANLLWGAFANTYGSPLKALEYMAMGKPIVLAGEGQAARLIASAQCGAAVAIGDHRALAEASANVLLLAESARESLGMNGREWVVANASWSATAESILTIIRQRVFHDSRSGATTHER